ncbi:MAG: glycosyltransferase family 39 protein [Candidatus Latescibacteria bacterium]|nr:glycosyltransferase family 39 protein [Candidatus Latescibacterota bacterium]
MKLCLIVPTAVGALIRLVHLAFLAVRDPLFAIPIVDSRVYLGQAAEILKTGLLAPGSPAYAKGPLYSYFLAGLLCLFPEEAEVTIAARVASTLFGVGSIWLIARSAQLLGGSQAAWAAGLAAALNGTAVYFDATVLPEPLVSVLLLGAAHLLLRVVVAGYPAGPGLFAAGLVLGLAAITRANLLLCLVAAVGYLACRARRARLPGMAPAQALGLLLSGGVLVVGLVTARNVLVAHDLVLVSANGGINLYMGNDPAFEQGSGNWHSAFTWGRIAEAPRRLGYADGAGQEGFFLQQTLARAAAGIGPQARVLGHKLALLFTAYEIPNNRRIAPMRELSPVLWVLMAEYGWFHLPLSVLGPLAMVGLMLAAATRLPGRGLYLILAGACALTPVLFFNTARYRLPVVLLLLPVAAAGWVRARQRPGEIRRLFPWWAGGLLVFLVVSAITIPDHPPLPPSDEIWLAEEKGRHGQEEAMVGFCRRAVQRYPDDPIVRERAANALSDGGRWREAWGNYQELYRMSQTHGTEWAFTALYGSAQCLVAEGKYEAALAAYQRLLELNPDAPTDHAQNIFHLRDVPPFTSCETRIPMALLLVRLGRLEEALAQVDSVTSLCAADDDLDRRAHALEAQVSAMLGQSKGQPRPEAPGPVAR